MLFRDHSLAFRIPNVNINEDISVIEIGYNLLTSGLRHILKRDIYGFHYITKGSGTFCDHPFDNTNSYLVVPGEIETIEVDDEYPYECYWIKFKGNHAHRIIQQLNLNHNCVFTVSRSKECAEIIQEALFKEDYVNDTEEAYTLLSVFYKIIALHMTDIKETAPSNSIAIAAANYIKKNYHTTLEINNLAKNLHISRNYLYTLFKQEYGVSPQEYLISYRIEQAKSLLSNYSTNLSIKKIANATGFENSLYFSRLFHARTGLTPSQFRKNG